MRQLHNNDWDKIHNYAITICNLSAKDLDDSETRGELFLFLDSLEKKYGTISDILATKGDFSENTNQSIEYWEKAYQLAKQEDHKKNLSLISGSLAEAYVLEKEDFLKGREWLNIFQKEKVHYSDNDLESLILSLNEKINTLLK